MNSRERVKSALNHLQPDKVPIDLGATAVTGISASALSKLRKVLNLEDRLVKVHEPFQLLGEVEEDVLKTLGVDIVGLWSESTFFGYKNTGWKPWQLPDGIEVLIGDGFEYTEDPHGNLYTYPQGDRSVAPCAKLPKGGYYFDNLVRQEEFDEDDLDGRRDFREQFSLYGEQELRSLEEKAKNIHNNSEYAMIGLFAGAALGDAALLPAANLKRTPGIRKLEDWLMAHILYPNYVKEIFEYQTEVAIENLKLYKQAVGDKIQAIFVSGTDFGTQRCEMISPDCYREFYMPYFRRINDWIHINTSWKTFYHTCGSVVKLLDDFAETGIDILNPVQCSAEGMDPKFLKEKYGHKFTFWGGAVDTQKTLPFGTPDEVRQQTLDRISIFSKGGGFIFNSIHNIQSKTPVENIQAFFDAVREFNDKSGNVKRVSLGGETI